MELSAPLSFFQAVLEQGGLFACILVIGFFYRRDFKLLVAEERVRSEELLEVVRANTAAMTKLEQTIAIGNGRRRAAD